MQLTCAELAISELIELGKFIGSSERERFRFHRTTGSHVRARWSKARTPSQVYHPSAGAAPTQHHRSCIQSPLGLHLTLTVSNNVNSALLFASVTTNMHKKTIYFALVAYLVFNAVDAKKSRRNKRPKDEDSTPQPNVVTYSTFGFNDVGTYDGFVPSSPDYANYLSNYNQESSTRLYAPAFPTAMDSAGFNSNFGSQSQDARPFNLGDDNIPQASMLQYPQSSMSFYNTPSLDNNEGHSQTFPSEDVYGHYAGEVNSPVYGTKLSSKNINRPLNLFNNTEFNVFGSGSPNPSDDKFSSFHEVQSSYESKPTTFGESSKNNYQNTYNNAPSFSATGNDDFMKSTQSNSQNSVKFQKVVDFTKMRPNYPTDLDFKFPTATNKPLSAFGTVSNNQNENTNTNDFEEPSSKFSNPTPSFRDRYKDKEVEDVTEKQIIKPMAFTDTEFSHNSVGSFNNFNNKNPLKGTKFSLDFKDKFKYRPWSSTNYTNDYKNAKNPLKGYQYSTNFSNTSFEFDFSGGGKNENVDNKFTNNNDEVVPAASSNVVDLTSDYQFPENDYSNFKKIPNIKGFGDDYPGLFQSLKHQEKYDPADYVKSLYSTTPTTTTHWGSVYKAPEVSFKQQIKKPQFVDEITDEVVHIPKRPYSNKYNYGKFTDSKPTDWSSFHSYRPHKFKKPQNDWNKDVPTTRFKSEEDLLGLRTHDTSHPSYLPTYRPNSNSLSSDYDYKKLVEKWRQSYLKAKYKDTFHDFEGFPTENKPLHVPVPKPYPVSFCVYLIGCFVTCLQ